MTAVPLEDARDEGRYGGKAVQLGAAARAGLAVPAGFALEWALVERVAAGDAAARAQVHAVCAALGGPCVARSSAVGEDGATASFAGQHATVLNVRAPDALVDAVTAVSDSGAAPAALAYRQRAGLSGAPRVGVVVQTLVDAERAGVLFTRDPLSGRDERVIEAAWGLGEAVVAGLVTPDRYRLDRTGRVLERAAGHKDTEIAPRPEGGTHARPVRGDRARAHCLDDAHLAALHRLALQVEGAFRDGGAHDLEWAFDRGGALYLLQRRAITTTPWGDTPR